MINRFIGPYAFLSNFAPTAVVYEAICFPTVEHAYQAAKTDYRPSQLVIQRTIGAGMAKRIGRAVGLREDWEEVKIEIMRQLLRQKFATNTLYARELMLTGKMHLQEGNNWNDNFWGVCGGSGHNWLGRLLMERRAQLIAWRHSE